jgi:hypothetical protein
MRGKTLLRGHALRWEGAGRREDHRGRVTQQAFQRGFALCECGARSPVLQSDAARRRWHRDHKDAIRTEEARRGA